MPRLCYGCGLAEDDDGNLIAAVSTADPALLYPGCGVNSLGNVYCDARDGKLHVDPPAMYRQWRFVHEIATNPATGNGELTQYGFNQAMDFPETRTFTSGVGTITNPSCRPMQLFLEIGIQHGLFTVDAGGPDANDTALGDIQIESYYSLSGDITATNIAGGHQHWGAEARGGTPGRRQIYRMDSSGAFLDANANANGTSPFILPAGGSVTITSEARIIVIRYATTGDGSVRLENFRTTMRATGWSGA